MGEHHNEGSSIVQYISGNIMNYIYFRQIHWEC